TVQVAKSNESGELLPLALLEASDLFGEMALFDGAPRSATVSTVQRCEFFVLSPEAAMDFLSRWPHLLQTLVSNIVGRFRTFNESFLEEVVEKHRLHVELERERYRSISQLTAGSNEAVTIQEAGVETAEGLEYLREVNFTYVQGFHVSMPVSAEE